MRFPGFIGPSYTHQSVNVDAQRCVNLFTEIDPTGHAKEGEGMSLVPTPGLLALLTLPTSPVRGLWRGTNGTLFAVGGNKAYSVSSSWVATELGTLNTSTGRVGIADNGISVVFVDGTYGYSCTIAGASFVQITDPDFHASTHVAFQDGYLIFNNTGTQQFFITGLYDLTFDALDFASAEASPDVLVGLSSVNQNVVLFSAQTIEVFYNSGNADFPFARMQGAVAYVGCSAANSIAKLGEVLYWVGGDDTGSCTVYRSQGYKPQRISTPAIETVIRRLTADQLAAATAFTYQQGGHSFYCLNLPGTKTTWVFDSSTEMWHERTYLTKWGIDRHRAEVHAVAYGKNVVGDYETGNIYALDPDTLTDNGVSIQRVRAAPHFSSGLKYVRHKSFQLDLETGVGINGTAQGSDPKVMLRFSDDGGHTWSNEIWADIGKIGKYGTRAIWRRLGVSRDRIYEITISDPVKVVIGGAELEVEEGAA